MKIIGITGAAMSGKDTAAQLIKDIIEETSSSNEVSSNVVICSFASALKHEVTDALDIPIEYLTTQGEKKEAFRPLLQVWGDTQKLLHGQNYWIDKMVNAITAQNTTFTHLIISDVRYDFEAEWIFNHGGTIIQMVREGGITTAHTTHTSEAGLNEALTRKCLHCHNDPRFGKEVLKDQLEELLCDSLFLIQ